MLFESSDCVGVDLIKLLILCLLMTVMVSGRFRFSWGECAQRCFWIWWDFNVAPLNATCYGAPCGADLSAVIDWGHSISTTALRNTPASSSYCWLCWILSATYFIWVSGGNCVSNIKDARRFEILACSLRATVKSKCCFRAVLFIVYLHEREKRCHVLLSKISKYVQS